MQEFAKAQKFHETAVALSLLCALPVGLIERGLVRDSSDLVLVFAKALGLDWETTRSIAVLGAGESGRSPQGFEETETNFKKLSRETAQKAVRFYRLREQSRNPVSAAADWSEPTQLGS